MPYVPDRYLRVVDTTDLRQLRVYAEQLRRRQGEGDERRADWLVVIIEELRKAQARSS